MDIQKILPQAAICMFGVACFDPIVGEWSLTERCFESESETALITHTCWDYPYEEEDGSFQGQRLIIDSDYTGSLRQELVASDGTILFSDSIPIVAQKIVTNEYSILLDAPEATEELYYDCNLSSNTLVCIEDWYVDARYVSNFERP